MFFCIILYCTLLVSNISYTVGKAEMKRSFIVFYNVLLYNTALHSIVLYYIVLHSFVLYTNVVHCIFCVIIQLVKLYCMNFFVSMYLCNVSYPQLKHN